MGRNIRILIIEDDPVVRESYSLVLTLEGFEIFEAGSGTQGLGIFIEKHPDLVLLDVRLPDMDGRDVCQYIKSDTARADTSVILISGEATSESEKVVGFELGADDYLVKPVRPAELLARVRSILRLRQTADALRASEQYYRRLVEILPDAVVLVNLQGRLLSANPRALTMLGCADSKELVDRSVFEFLHPQQHERFSTVLGETVAMRAVRNLEFSLVRPDGQATPVELSTASLDTSQGHALTLVLVLRDISYRKEAEAALTRDRFLRKAILDNISDAAWLKDAKGHFLACNEALAKFYGKKPIELLGITEAELVSPQRAEELAREDLAVISSGNPARFEAERINAQGEKRWFETVKSPLFSHNGECVGTVGIARDTTERRRLEQELRLLSRQIIQAQEAERFRVARELHDSVNQLLASVQMRIRRVEQSLADARPSTREILARCHEQIILAMEESRRIAHGLRPGDLDELGLAVCCRNFCRQFMARTSLQLRFSIRGLSERLPRETELNLFRIVQEAFANIEKHARATQVRLSLARRAGKVVLLIHDNGCGFASKPGPIARRTRSGLGLTNMKERAASLGGTCELKSVPGKGTTVAVRVSLEQKARSTT